MTLKISHGTKTKNIAGTNGYGYATQGMLASLDRLGYQVSQNDASADVEIWFDQPQHWKFSPGTYKIGYHPWESTKLKDGWVEIMNKCDEIWTPSPLIAQWYKTDGVTVPIYVYEHGIDHIWNPEYRRERGDDKLRFLHVGAEATRKGGWDTLRLFRQAFGNNKDVELTLKIVNSSWNNIDRIGKTNIINRVMSFPELQSLFYAHDVYVYPSYGEGFGLTPLQAIATGMPTITTPAWAPYARFLDPNLNVGSQLKKSTWQKIHPGYMLRPNFDEVIDRMRYAYDNYDDARAFAASKVDQIHSEYDWDTITKKVFGDLEKRLAK